MQYVHFHRGHLIVSPERRRTFAKVGTVLLLAVLFNHAISGAAFEVLLLLCECPVGVKMLHTRAREKMPQHQRSLSPPLRALCDNSLLLVQGPESVPYFGQRSGNVEDMLQRVRRPQRQNEVPVSVSCQHTEWSCSTRSSHAACGSDALICFLALIGPKCSMKPLSPSVDTYFRNYTLRVPPSERCRT